MALSRQTVLDIIKIVEDDPDCRDRANSWLRFLDIADSGTPGIIRNYSIGLVYTYLPEKLAFEFDPLERESMAYEYSCDGIAEVTARAIQKKILQLPAVERASEQGRLVSYSHTGTLLHMKDGSKYVLDWWKSLNLACPFVFLFDDFMYCKSDGTPFFYFNGYD